MSTLDLNAADSGVELRGGWLGWEGGGGGGGSAAAKRREEEEREKQSIQPRRSTATTTVSESHAACSNSRGKQRGGAKAEEAAVSVRGREESALAAAPSASPPPFAPPPRSLPHLMLLVSCLLVFKFSACPLASTSILSSRPPLLPSSSSPRFASARLSAQHCPSSSAAADSHSRQRPSK